jgi:Uma2 family endonuclease
MAVNVVDEPLMVSDVLHRLGDVSPERVCLNPPPGKATVRDVIRYQDRHNRNFELIDGTLLEKTMGLAESLVASNLSRWLGNFVMDAHQLGIITGADGPMRVLGRQVRMPDVAYISNGRLSNGELPDSKVPRLVPNIAVEVLSEGNTPREMQRKLEEYLTAGVELVWYVDPESRTVMVYRPDATSTLLNATDDLTGEGVLPGFRIAVADLFKSLPSKIPTSKRKKT